MKIIYLILFFYIFLLKSTLIATEKFNINKYLINGNNINKIYLPAGIYLVSSPIILSSNTILEGEGSETILKILSPFLYNRVITNSDFYKGNKNIILRNFKIEFEQKDQIIGESPGIIRFENTEDLKIVNLYMEIDSPNYCIDLASNTRNAIIKDCNIINKGRGGGIMVRNKDPSPINITNNILIINNFLKSFILDEPLAVFGWLGKVNNIRVENNKIEAEGASFGITVYGIDKINHTGEIQEVIIKENKIIGAKHGSLGIKGGAKNVNVENNLISKASGDGIFIHSGGKGLPEVSNINIIQNYISNVGRHGILATGSEINIHRNKISNTKNSGIYLNGIIYMFENQIENCNPGILVDGYQKKIIRKNIFRNSPIRILNHNNLDIKDNYIE